MGNRNNGSDGKKSFTQDFTMIELMIVVIILAILASSAVPIYRTAVGRAYETEVMSTLGVIRYTQRKFLIENNRYADHIDELTIIKEDLSEMRNIDWEDFSVEGTDSGFIAVWEGKIDGYTYSKVTLDEKGNIERLE